MSRNLPIQRALFLSAMLLLCGTSHAQVSRMSSRFLARGEKALLEVAVSGMKKARFPKCPAW
jgi:hypothetical protein